MKKKYKVITHFTMFRDKKKQWRWNAKRVGRIVACSGEGYTSARSCLKSLNKFIDSIFVGNIIKHGVAAM